MGYGYALWLLEVLSTISKISYRDIDNEIKKAAGNNFNLEEKKKKKKRKTKNAEFPGGPDSKASVYNAGDPGLIPGSRRSPGERNGNPLQYSCLENPMDGGAW